MRPSTALRQAFDALGDEEGEEIERGPASVAELLDYYGGTAGIAEAAGFGSAAGARTRGADAVRAREAFMRRIRGYRQFEAEGRRRGSRARDWRRDPESRRLIERLVDEVRAKSDVERVADRIAAEGITVTGAATVWISEDEVEREWPPPGWYVSPAVLVTYGVPALVADRRWEELEEPFSDAFSTSYLGGPGMILVDVDYLELEVGRAPGARALKT